eukprot:6131073-Pleurochrysis_carterae.AAC.1
MPPRRTHSRARHARARARSHASAKSGVRTPRSRACARGAAALPQHACPYAHVHAASIYPMFALPFALALSLSLSLSLSSSPSLALSPFFTRSLTFIHLHPL